MAERSDRVLQLIESIESSKKRQIDFNASLKDEATKIFVAIEDFLDDEEGWYSSLCDSIKSYRGEISASLLKNTCKIALMIDAFYQFKGSKHATSSELDRMRIDLNSVMLKNHIFVLPIPIYKQSKLDNALVHDNFVQAGDLAKLNELDVMKQIKIDAEKKEKAAGHDVNDKDDRGEPLPENPKIGF